MPASAGPSCTAGWEVEAETSQAVLFGTGAVLVEAAGDSVGDETTMLVLLLDRGCLSSCRTLNRRRA